MGKRLILLAVLFVSAVGMGLFSRAWYVRETSTSVPAHEHEPQQVASTTVHRSPAGSQAAPVHQQASRTKREILAEYWGERWGALEGGFDARGADLDLRPAAGLPVPWKDVEAQFARVVRGDREEVLKLHTQIYRVNLTDADLSGWLNPEGKQLTADQLGELHAMADTYKADLTAAVDDVTDVELAYRQRIWEEGLYAVGPFYPIAGPAPSQRIHEMGPGTLVGSSRGGWDVTFRVDPNGDLSYERALALAKEVMDTRNRVLADIVSYY